VCEEADLSVVMRSQCAGAALDPPVWIVPNKDLSLSLSLSLSFSPFARVRGEADSSVVIRSQSADADLDPPLWIVPNKVLSPSLMWAELKPTRNNNQTNDVYPWVLSTGD
jgi:hypothetical protein